jgi:hypothetical protein
MARWRLKVIAYCYLRLDREEWIRAVVSAEGGASELDRRLAMRRGLSVRPVAR